MPPWSAYAVESSERKALGKKLWYADCEGMTGPSWVGLRTGPRGGPVGGVVVGVVFGPVPEPPLGEVTAVVTVLVTVVPAISLVVVFVFPPMITPTAAP